MSRKVPPCPNKLRIVWIVRPDFKREIEMIGKNIAYYRRRMNYTQSELAECCGVSDKHIYFVEKGLRHPSLILLLKISRVLNVPIWELTDYRGE